MPRLNVALGLCVVLLVATWPLRILLAGSLLLYDLRQLQAYERGEATTAELLSTIHSLRRNTQALRLELWLVSQPLRWLEPVPLVGADLAAAPALLDIAADVTYALDEACEPVRAALAAADSGPALAALGGSAAERQAQLAAARLAVQRARQATDGLPHGLAPGIRRQVDQWGPYLPTLEQVLVLLANSPSLLGLDEPRAYLFLAQNRDELRATGGFISTVGIVRLDQGRLELSVKNAYEIDNLAQKPYPAPPTPLRTYMGADLWLFRDANWSPHFPDSARTAAALYALGQAEPVSGVVAFDQVALAYLLEVLGPVELGAGFPAVTAATLEQVMRDTWTPESGDLAPEAHRYGDGVLKRLGNVLVSRLLNEPHSLHLPALLAALQRAFDEKHIQAYVVQPEVAGLLAAQGWDGGLRTAELDYLYVVDSNVGFNKANAIVRREIRYTADLTDIERPKGELAVAYALPTNRITDCQHIDDAYGAQGYEYEVNKCYWNYLRVYVPGESKLAEFTPWETPGRWLWSGRDHAGEVSEAPGEQGTLVFSQLLVIPHQTRRETVLKYALPATVIHHRLDSFEYCVRVPKQPGNDSTVAVIRIVLPAESRLLDATPPLHTLNGTMLVFDAIHVQEDFEACATFSRN